MTVHIVRTLKTIRKESVTNQTCYFAPCHKTQRMLMALPNLAATPKQLMHITVGQNGSVDQSTLWDLCPRGFRNPPYKLIRNVEGDKANGLT